MSGPLYPTHIALNAFQKTAVTAVAAMGALLRPSRADLVAAVGETTGTLALQQMLDRMRADPVGQEILRDKPRVTDHTLSQCAALPVGTFGQQYHHFMAARRFEAGERPPVRFVDDQVLAYVACRAREVHDFWHVLFNCHTNVFGELSLKALEYVQTGLPMTALAVVGAQFRLPREDRLLLWRHYLPWALKAGMQSRDLMCIYYEQHFHRDLEELRQEWNILPAPHPPARLAPKLKPYGVA